MVRWLAGWNRIALAVTLASLSLIVVWTIFGLTPSSYGGFLQHIGAQQTGVLAGQPRQIRRDEWSILTPYFQATVRNGFERFNHTSFYGEDLRNINALPLRDWGIVFKPQFWAFFVLAPANAFGFYYGCLMAAFLAGYFLLFQELGLDSEYAVAASLVLFCCGFTQFWWTSSGPSLAFLPWVALPFLRPCAWFVRAPLTAYALTVWVISCGYPILIISGGMALVVLVAALRGDTLRSVARVAAAGAGFVLAGALVYFYLADAITAIKNTVYPALRRAPPGTVPPAVLLSQLWPAFTFAASDFRHLVGDNICEIGAAGSFLPLLTLCTLDYSRFRRSIFDPGYRGMWRALALIGLAIGLTTWWMAGSCPKWIGRLLYWDHFTANRLLFLAGLLVLMVAFIPWQRGMVTVTPLRAAVFVALGPIAATIVKIAAFGVPASELKLDFVCAGLAAACALATTGLRRPTAAYLMVGCVVAINGLVFLRFNPLQSADPIFGIPDSNTLELLNAEQAATPGAYLAIGGYPGATLNGLGLRAVNHQLIRPEPDFFRKYFPGMEQGSFDRTFKRYAWVDLREVPFPFARFEDEIDVPIEVFRPVRNLRRAVIEAGAVGCREGRDNPFGLSSQGHGPDLTIEGWAPWVGESAQQSLVLRTERRITVRSLSTLPRLDIAEIMHNYQMVKAGFRLVLSAEDGGPLSLEDMRLSADGTTYQRTPIDGCPAE